MDELGATKDQVKAYIYVLITISYSSILQCSQLQSDLSQYEAAYDQLSGVKDQLEEQLTDNSELLQQSESMRRRLDDTVIELQGQLAIEEQRSKFCTIL